MFLLAPTHARAEPGGVAAATPVGGGASVTRPAAEVEFHATEPDVSFQIRSGEATVRGMNVDVFSPICVAPCTATLPLGTNRIALSKDGAARVQLSDELTIVGPSRIDAKYTSYAQLRYAGLVLMIGSAVVGTTLFIASMSATQHHCFDPNDCFDQPGVDKTMSGAGIATLVIGSLIGLGLATHHDSAEVTVVPLRLDAPAVARREGGARTLDGSGLALRVRF